MMIQASIKGGNVKRIIALALLFTSLAVMASYSFQEGAQVRTLTTELNASGGIAVDEQGFIYVADFGISLANANGTKVYKVDPSNGSYEVFAEGFTGASGNDFDSQGNLIQASIGANEISRITPEGEVTTIAVQADGIQGPVGIAVDPNDNIYVANCAGGSIARISADGLEKGIWVRNGPLACPNGLTIDDNGNLYTSNYNLGTIVKISPDGEMTILGTTPGRRNSHITYANGVLYVAARSANQIYQVTLDGEFTLLAGSGEVGNADGNALESTTYVPNGIRTSPDGKTLYWNDAVETNGSRLNPALLRSLDLEIEDEAPDDPDN